MDTMWMARAHALAKAAPSRLGQAVPCKSGQAVTCKSGQAAPARLGAGETVKEEPKQRLAITIPPGQNEPDVSYQSMSFQEAIQRAFDQQRIDEGKIASEQTALAALQARVASLEMASSQTGTTTLQTRLANLEAAYATLQAKVMENSNNIIQLDKNQRQTLPSTEQSAMHSFKVCPLNQ